MQNSTDITISKNKKIKYENDASSNISKLPRKIGLFARKKNIHKYLSRMFDFIGYWSTFCISYSCCLLKFRGIFGGLYPQSALKAIFSSCAVRKGWVLCETLLSRASLACSTRLRLMEYARHCIRFTSFILVCLMPQRPVWEYIIVRKQKVWAYCTPKKDEHDAE